MKEMVSELLSVQGDSVITVPARDGDTGIDDTIIYSFNSSWCRLLTIYVCMYMFIFLRYF